ncbi:hypothetical protein HW555_004573 [Spodoptera exigua]|uniref:Uncharacterized protein n=1 Tax=Spodoptera exigua TaxID=7107 RepID=A0A835L656_SPOEX|nr:hypothetical protein HW555_004573 [Spodoptera exigua]
MEPGTGAACGWVARCNRARLAVRRVCPKYRRRRPALPATRCTLRRLTRQIYPSLDPRGQFLVGADVARVTEELPTSMKSAARGTGGLDPRVRAMTTSEASPVPILQYETILKWMVYPAAGDWSTSTEGFKRRVRDDTEDDAMLS